MVLDKLPDAANLALGALVFGPFVSGAPVSLPTAAIGLAIWAVVFGGCLLLSGRRRR